MALTQESIDQRKALYTLCYANATWDRHTAIVHGHVAKQKHYEERMVLIQWGLDLLCNYSADGECAGHRTVTEAEVCCAIKLIDPCCKNYGCSDEQPAPISCDPVITYQVIRTVAVSERTDVELASPQVGDMYYVTSGSIPDVWTLNDVVTWNGTGWDITPLVNEQIVRSQETGDLWTVLDGTTPGLLYPPVILDLVGPNGLYSVTSAFPAISSNAGRQIELRALINGTWVTLYYGEEAILANPSNFLIGRGSLSNIVVVYKRGGCEWTSGALSNPPFGQCGTITSVLTPVAICLNSTFFIGVDIQSVSGYPIGNIVPEVNGVPQAGVPGITGMNIVGDFPITSSVRVRIQNAFDPDCDFVSDPIVHPDMPVVNYQVYAAVDASFQPFVVPGRSYLITGNVNSVVNTFANNVGRIWDGTNYITPADLDIVLETSATGTSGYWQLVSGVPVRVFAPATAEYNTITQVYTVSPPVIAPFVSGRSVNVSFRCGTGPETSLYTGPIGLLVPIPFSSGCSIDSIVVTTTYQLDCPLLATSDVEPYTPTGDPDPDFSDGGLNDAVYAVQVDSSDRIIVGGIFTAYDVTPVGRFARLNSDGTLDTAFNTAIGTGFNGPVRDLIIDSLGRYLVIGDFTEFDGTTVGRIARIDPSGNLDTAFNTAIGTGFNSPAFDLIDLGDDTYIISGNFSLFDGVNYFAIIKIDINGAPVAAFRGEFSSGPGPTALDPFDGNVICNSGSAGSYQGGVPLGPVESIGGTAPFGALFKIDSTTGEFLGMITKGAMFNGYALPLPLPNGNIVVTGQFTQYDGQSANRIAMIEQDGDFAQPFRTNVGTGFNGETTNATLLPNGQIAVCMVGATTTFNGQPTNGLVLLNQNGTRDAVFNSVAPGFTGGRTVFMKIKSTGELVAVGWFTGLNGVTRLRVAQII